MNTFNNQSMSSSTAPSISDLDGFTLGRDYNFPITNSYIPADQDEFGFDPPSGKGYLKAEQTSTPPGTDSLWPGFEREDDTKQSILQNYSIDRMIAQTLPDATNAISRFGQITPPRSNSAASPVDNAKFEDSLPPTAPTSERRKRTKTQSAGSAPAPKATSGRKRKNGKKIAAGGDTDNPEEVKRKASLEKNRLAAAKCRVNKKEKTEQLQRDSHEKGLHNAFLREQILRMKSEVQHMHAILLTHANCDGCKSPEEIQKHLATIGQEYMANHMLTDTFDDYSQMQMDGLSQEDMGDDYFSSMSPENAAILHPPLPEFDRSAEFDVSTPMQTD